MRVRVPPSVEARIRDEAYFYLTHASLDVARRIARELREAIDRLADKHIGSRIEGLPVNYQRVKVKPFYIFYRLDAEGDYVLVYLIRHEKQRPFTPAIHKRLAARAEREAT
jgi:plasmid stabilization system protein ParE